MGVDITGINPIIKSPKPQEIENWDEVSKEEKDKYWESIKAWEQQNPGEYFGSSWWSWRPIVYLIDEANMLFSLGIDTNPFHYNDGKGLETQEECDKLANGLEYILDNNEETKEEDAQIYLCTTSWSRLGGTLVSEEVCQKLSQTYAPGSIRFSWVVTPDGEVAVPSHSVSVSRVRDFIAFLRECGGFCIY